LNLVPQSEVGRHFAQITPMIKRVIDKTEEVYGVGDILEGLAKGKMRLWLNDNGIVITEVSGNVFNIGLCAGDNIDGWIDEIISECKKSAKANGCEYIQEVGRRGWVKKMAKFDFKESGTIMRCKL